MVVIVVVVVLEEEIVTIVAVVAATIVVGFRAFARSLERPHTHTLTYFYLEGC